MTNEAVMVDRLEGAINFTCADGTGIEKGTILKITDPRTASAADGVGERLAGIAAEEKIANDGRTSIGVFRKGIFELNASGAISVGDRLMVTGVDNEVKLIGGVGTSGAACIGTALETATDDETIQVFVDIQGVSA